MKDEVLRLDNVTYLDQGVMELNHFSLNVFAGEIMGLIPVNGNCLQSLLRLLRQNLPIHYGYIHYRERLVNHWLHSDLSYNRISIIENRSGLADDLTVADNVFVLRHGFKKQIIHRGVLRRQLASFLQDIDVTISADAYVRDLTTFQRFVVELVKAVVAGNRLVILIDAGTIVSDAELDKLQNMLRHYAARGISFLYVSQHYEEMRHICDRVALMMNGQIAKILPTKETEPETIHCFDVEHYKKMIRTQTKNRSPAAEAESALEIRDLWHGSLAGLNISFNRGECVVVQDLDNHVLEDFVDLFTRNLRPRRGALLVSGVKATASNRRDIAVIQKLAASSMLFPELSYLDNLCFMADHRLPRIWMRTKCKAGIREECASRLGRDVFDKNIDELTQMQKYDLIYARILLQRPKVVFCVQPFMQADVEQRMHIWMLLEQMLEKRITVVILAVNLADTLSLADRLIQLRDGRVYKTYERGEFGALPDSTPWHYLWSDRGKQRERETASDEAEKASGAWSDSGADDLRR